MTLLSARTQKNLTPNALVKVVGTRYPKPIRHLKLISFAKSPVTSYTHKTARQARRCD